MKKIFLISLLYFGFSQNDISGVWLTEEKPTIFIINDNHTYKVTDFWDDRDGESETYDWESVHHGTWFFEKNRLCFQHGGGDAPEDEKDYPECFRYQLYGRNLLVIDFRSEGGEKVRYIRMQ